MEWLWVLSEKSRPQPRTVRVRSEEEEVSEGSTVEEDMAPIRELEVAILLLPKSASFSAQDVN